MYMEQTSDKQRKMLHAMFGEIANQLAENGVTMQQLISKSFDLIPNKDSVKALTKIIIKHQWNLDSTNNLSSKQIDILIDMWVKKLGEEFGIELTTPEDYE